MMTLVVRDYDEAIAWYTRVLGFTLVEDTRLSEEKRWVVVRAGDEGASLLLARAATESQRAAIGNQAGGRVLLFLHTDDFDRDAARYAAGGAMFVQPRRVEPYGIVGVFEDLYGNRWDLIQRT